MKSKIQHWDDMYARPVENLPWEIPTPPKELVEVLHGRAIVRGRALDIGCGSGNYSIYLAHRGFQVTGVDFSSRALAIARRRATRAKLKITFVRADARSLSRKLNNRYDFILDYSLLHHISDADLKKYALQCNSLLKPGGKLLLVCYSEKDGFAKGRRVVRGKYGNMMYYRTRREIEAAYGDLHKIFYKKVRLGKRLQHLGHCFLFSYLGELD